MREQWKHMNCQVCNKWKRCRLENGVWLCIICILEENEG